MKIKDLKPGEYFKFKILAKNPEFYRLIQPISPICRNDNARILHTYINEKTNVLHWVVTDNDEIVPCDNQGTLIQQLVEFGALNTGDNFRFPGSDKVCTKVSYSESVIGYAAYIDKQYNVDEVSVHTKVIKC